MLAFSTLANFQPLPVGLTISSGSKGNKEGILTKFRIENKGIKDCAIHHGQDGSK